MGCPKLIGIPMSHESSFQLSDNTFKGFNATSFNLINKIESTKYRVLSLHVLSIGINDYVIKLYFSFIITELNNFFVNMTFQLYPSVGR